MKPVPLSPCYVWPRPNDVPPSFSKTFIPDAAYAFITAGTVQNWIDVLPYSVGHEALVLATRCILPMNEGPWEFGGRWLPGETRLQAAIRHFRDDTSIVLDESRLVFIGSPEYIYRNRQQHPQNVPVHGIIHTFAVAVTDTEVAGMNDNLNLKEYQPNSVDFYGWEDLQGSNIHQALRDHYRVIFDQAA